MSPHVGHSLVKHRLLILRSARLVCDRSFLTFLVAPPDASEEHGEDDDTGEDGASNEDVDPCIGVVIIRISARLVVFYDGYGAVLVRDRL